MAAALLSPLVCPQADQAAYEEQMRQRQQQSAGSSSPSDAASDDSPSGAYGSGSGGRTVEYGSTAAVPEVVTDRMLKRVILFMGTPVFGGILLFPLFYYLKARVLLRVVRWVVRAWRLAACIAWDGQHRKA